VPYYVTTPIYYVNAAPHLGHAYTTIGADILARHMRQRGEEVFFLTGTDEHGEPVAIAAEREGVTPQELADRNAERFKALAPLVNASNDFFIRTSDPEHVRRVQEFLTRIKDNGYVYEGTYDGWYCPRCADFKNENEIGPDNTCLIHTGFPLVLEHEDNYFFKLSDFQERLEQLYADRPDFVQPAARYNEALSFIKSGLRDVSLSRANLRWGVPVPWDESHVFYVWFDALLNYYTALAFAKPGEDLTAKFWPANYHLIGKDILKFHGVFWPAMLMAAGEEVPQHLFVHGFLTTKGADGEAEKMSKSLGNVIDPFEIIEKYGADALRYYCFRDVAFGQDGAVSPVAFEQRYDTELANALGNLASRSIAMIHRYRDGVVPSAPLHPAIVAEFDGLAERVAELLDRAEVTAALEEIWARVRRLNGFVEEQAPWKLAKVEEQAAELDAVLVTLAEGIRVIAVLLSPYLPASMDTLLGALHAPDVAYDGARLGAGQLGPIDKIDPLFPRIEADA